MADLGLSMIGAQAPAGTERFRVTGGAVLFDGTTGATPVSGASTRFMWIPAKNALRAGGVNSSQWDNANVGNYSVCFGENGMATGTYSFAIGSAAVANAASAIAMGYGASASATYSVAIGRWAVASISGQFARSYGQFGASGDSQLSDIGLMRASTDAGAVELTLDGTAPAAGTRLTIASGRAMRFHIHLVCLCTAGTHVGSVATWEIKGAIKNIGGTTALVGSVISDATATDAALAAATAVVTADDPNDCLAITCTGIVGTSADTFRWHAAVYLSEVAS